MENYPIKSVAFGGFDKQDVVQYIERAAQEAAAAEKALREENEELRYQLEELKKEADAREGELQAAISQRDSFQEKLEKETATLQELEPLRSLKEEVERITAERDALRPDAEAYAQFRESIGAIECEARERAAELENATVARLRRTVERFRGQYQALMTTFEGTAAHVTGELRKVEVNLSQLPRAMDQAGTELNELAALLDKRWEETGKKE